MILLVISLKAAVHRAPRSIKVEEISEPKPSPKQNLFS